MSSFLCRCAAARRAAPCALFAATLVASAPAGAGIILEPGLYRLHDHPGGNAQPPGYGLRLDELIDVTPDHDLFSFSFDHPAAEMFLEISDVDGSLQLHIFGTAWGGLDVGSDYDAAIQGPVELDFLYALHVERMPGDDDLRVAGPNFQNTGTIRFDFGDGLMEVPLFDRGMDGYTFQLGDKDGSGHRGFDGISGWGWVDHGTAGVHFAASDWLFTVDPTPVPAPAALALLLAGAAPRRRQRAR